MPGIVAGASGAVAAGPRATPAQGAARLHHALVASEVYWRPLRVSSTYLT